MDIYILKMTYIFHTIGDLTEIILNPTCQNYYTSWFYVMVTFCTSYNLYSQSCTSCNLYKLLVKLQLAQSLNFVHNIYIFKHTDIYSKIFNTYTSLAFLNISLNDSLLVWIYYKSHCGSSDHCYKMYSNIT